MLVPYSKWKLSLIFQQPMLGTVPYNREVYSDHIATKKAKLSPVNPNPKPLTEEQLAEELATIEEAEERGWTGFHREPGTRRPFIYDYMVKGFLKHAASSLNRLGGSETKNIKAFIKVIDDCLFIKPRFLLIKPPVGQSVDSLIELTPFERPLRCQTPQGERVTVARADIVPIGCSVDFVMSVFDSKVKRELLTEWFDYGEMRGLGQWANGGYGVFSYMMEQVM